MAHRILIVDDELSILNSLRRLFRPKGYEITIAQSGDEAVDILETERFSMIISDQRMPGMTGAELLQKASEMQPQMIRIMLTGYSDIQAAMSAINDGKVYRFLSKPWKNEALLEIVAEALAALDIKREHETLQEEVRQQNIELEKLNQSLERKVQERTDEINMTLQLTESLNKDLRRKNAVIIKAFAGLLDLRSRDVGAHCRRVAEMTSKACKYLKITDPQIVETTIVSALLHDIGKIALPDSILLKDPDHLAGEYREEAKKHPVLGASHLEVIDGLAQIAKAIRHHHENVDGTGYPDGLKGSAIPMEARIIHVLDAYDHATKGGARTGTSQKLAIEQMDRQVGKRFDCNAFNALLSIVEKGIESDAVSEKKIPLEKLCPGMTLTRDLVSASGILLVAKNETLRDAHLKKIASLTKIYDTEPFAYIFES